VEDWQSSRFVCRFVDLEKLAIVIHCDGTPSIVGLWGGSEGIGTLPAGLAWAALLTVAIVVNVDDVQIRGKERQERLVAKATAPRAK
jgi:hypothetical protein